MIPRYTDLALLMHAHAYSCMNHDCVEYIFPFIHCIYPFLGETSVSAVTSIILTVVSMTYFDVAVRQMVADPSSRLALKVATLSLMILQLQLLCLVSKCSEQADEKGVFIIYTTPQRRQEVLMGVICCTQLSYIQHYFNITNCIVFVFIAM